MTVSNSKSASEVAPAFRTESQDAEHFASFGADAVVLRYNVPTSSARFIDS